MSLQNSKISTYKISRDWFDWCFENPDKAKPTHTAIFFFALDQNNRFGWKDKFGFPTLHAMEGTGIKSKNTYYKAFHELVEWDFIRIIEKSRNQNSANIISISAVLKFKSAHESAEGSALDSANIQHEDSRGNVDKQVNHKNNKQENEKDLRALEFLKIKKRLRFESEFQMKYADQIQDKKKFAEDFNDTVDQENLEYNPKILFARLGKYARNWIENQKKFSKNSPHKPKSNVTNDHQRGPKIGRLSEEEGNKLSNPEGWTIAR